MEFVMIQRWYPFLNKLHEIVLEVHHQDVTKIDLDQPSIYSIIFKQTNNQTIIMKKK